MTHELMRPIFKRDKTKTILLRFNEQYPDDEYMIGWKNPCAAGEIRKNLQKLDLGTCSYDDVDSALGVGGWTSNKCDVCDAEVEALLRIGQEPDYDARWQDICLGCLQKGTVLLEAALHRSPAHE